MSLLASATLILETGFMAHENWQQVKEIFADALRQTPKERPQFLDRVCSDDKNLRGEVESLLASFDSAESFMESPAVGDYATDKVLTESRKFAQGQILGHYEIIRQIGTGGMGDVYLANDLELQRHVAIKILHENLSWKSQAKQRLLREARAVAKLDHPNICAIYEISEAEDCSFIVMQFVSGETLADILTKQRLSVEKSLDLAIQIADALEEAHLHHIIHRDIKPSNIIVNNKGQLKVLDFGLAKIIEAETDEKATNKLSSSGAIMGTVPYMSPEQLRGKTLDVRTDIFSFGVLLYEMLSGISPFQHDSNAESISSILNDEPDLNLIPPELRPIIRKSLMKKKNERYQTAKNLLFDLKNLPLDSIENSFFESDAGKNSTTVQELNFSTDDRRTRITKDEADAAQLIPQTKNHQWIWAVSALAVLIVGFASWSWWRSKQMDANPSAPLSFSQFASWKRDLTEDAGSSARFSPDGKLVAFVSTRGETSAIWLKQVGGGEPFTRKQDKWQESSPVFSPDSDQIAFLSKRGEQYGIWAMPTLGGTPVLLKSLDGGYKQLVKWSKDGSTIYFQSDKNFFALDLPTKEIKKLTDFDSSPVNDPNFDISSDEENIAYLGERDGQQDMWVVSKNGGEAVRVTNDEFKEGRLVWHTDGQRIVYNAVRNGISQIFVVGLDGKSPVQLFFSDTNTYVNNISPDGKKILYFSERVEADLWKVNLDDLKETRLTENVQMEFWADVAPDNSGIVFQAERTNDAGRRIFHSAIISQTNDGTNQSLELSGDGFLPRFSPDGKQIAFLQLTDKLFNLRSVPTNGGEVKPITTEGIVFSGFSEKSPFNRAQTQEYQWSSDSRSLIYCARRGKISNLWQAAADGSGENRLTDNTDTNLKFYNPVFSPDDKRIAFSGEIPTTEAQKAKKWAIWIYENGAAKMIYQSESRFGLLGWSSSGSELIIKSAAGLMPLPADFDLLQISADSGAERILSQMKKTYFFNVRLSPDRQTIAFVTRKDGTDSIHVVSIKDGTDRTILTGNDARVYLANLVFSPDGKAIYFGKEANWQVISIIENFK
jgi:serine/threonine protein kinase